MDPKAMNKDILKKLEQKMDRRSFLRGSGLAAAALVGVAAFPLVSAAQDPTGGKQDNAGDSDKDKDKSKNKDEKADTAKDDKTTENKDVDPFKVTKKDESGRDYRLCPQCGYNMYKQDKTWTCENCGYSYSE
jgi:ribosomal protein S27AE